MGTSIYDGVQNSPAIVVGVEVTFRQSFDRFALVSCYRNCYRIKGSIIPSYRVYLYPIPFLFVKIVESMKLSGHPIL